MRDDEVLLIKGGEKRVLIFNNIVFLQVLESMNRMNLVERLTSQKCLQVTY